MKVKVEFDFEDISSDEHADHPMGLKAPEIAPKTRGFSGGCSCDMQGTNCYWTAASGNKYLHRLCSGAFGDCVSGYVYFYHLPGTGASGWHYCP